MINKCSQCGLCCRLFLVNLAEEEYLSGKYRTQLEEFGLINDFDKAAACGANILKQKKDGDCIYLRENKCSIHKIRPQICREFFCTSKLKKFRKMIKQIGIIKKKMLIKVKVFPESKEEKIIKKSKDSFDVEVRARAQGGKANREVVRALTSYFKVSIGGIRLIRGFKRRNKILEIISD